MMGRNMIGEAMGAGPRRGSRDPVTHLPPPAAAAAATGAAASLTAEVQCRGGDAGRLQQPHFCCCLL